MGRLPALLLTPLALILALPAKAQEDAYKAKYQINYNRFTRGDDAKVVDEAWGRLEWFRERMGGDLGPDFTRNLLREAEKERAKYPAHFQKPGGPEMPVALNGAAWVSLGPTTSDFTQNVIRLTKVDSGRLRTILVDTADTTGNTVYLLASGGGLWKTTNFLNAAPTWTPLTDFVGSNLSGSAAFGRSTSTLFVGAGDPFDAGIGGFVVKSTNGGSTWSPSVQLGTASKIYDLKVDTSQAQDVVLAGTNAGLFRSTDAGATFAAVASIPANLEVWSLEKTSAGWLAATESSTGAGALYRSTDQGATWSVVSTTAFSNASRITLGVGLPGDAVVYAFAEDQGIPTSAQLDLFRSPDGGVTWTPLGITSMVPTNPNADSQTMNVMRDQAFYNHMILVDPADPSRNTVYLGGQLFSAKSTNGGATWSVISNWLAQFDLPYIHADFHCAAYSNLGGRPRLYFGTDGGIFTSTDGGATWDDTKNKGLVNHLIYALAANPGVPGSALIGLQDNGTRIRSGLTSTFNQIRGGDGFGVGWAQNVTGSNAVSMSSYVYNAIRRSTVSPVVDQANWTSFTTGLVTPLNQTNYYFVTPIVTPPAGADPSGQSFLTYSRTGMIYQSNASEWVPIGMAGTGGISTGRIVRGTNHGVATSPTDLQHIAAAGTGGYLLLTANGGGSWTEVFLGTVDGTGAQVPGSLINGWQGFNANVAWANNHVLYACSEAPGVGAVRVAKSTNGGATWTAANGNLPDVPVTKLVVDPGDGTGNTVYAATWIGVYRTTNGGATWSVFGAGLPQGRVTDIWVAPDSSSIRVSTWGRGVWEITNNLTVGTVNINPATALFYLGEVGTFFGTVSGGGSVTYTATGGTITTGGVYTAGNAPGDFTVTATSSANPAQTAVAHITVAVPTPVSFSLQPQSVTVAPGHRTSFTVKASGSGALTYQWKKNGIAIAGATASTYLTPPLAFADTGSAYVCEVTGKAGTVASNPAILTVSALGTATSVTSTTVTAIPDATATAPGTPINIPFVVSGVSGNVGEVTFSLYLTHTWVGDLGITLVAPDNSSVVLSAGAGSNGSSPTGAAFGTSCGNYLVFSDLGAASINSQAAPPAIVGTFRPSFPLNAFNGKAPNGTWTLRIQDFGNLDVGTFQCGVLTVKPFGPSLDLNGDGTVDLRDLLFFAQNHGTATLSCDLNNDGTVGDADLSILLAGL